MAHINIFVTSVDPLNNKVSYTGTALVSPNFGPYQWVYEAEFNAIAVDINAGIKAAAIAVAEADGRTIGLADKKTVVAGAQDL